MRLGIAILAGLLVGGGYAWWSYKQDSESKITSDKNSANAAANAKPLYRWTDESGVTQITDRPPNNRPYKRISIRLDQNVVPSSLPQAEQE